MEDLMEVTPHIRLFNEVHTEYYRRTALKCETAFCCEELYFILYLDVRQHLSIYMNTIFVMENIYAERCAGIIGTLANILRHKGKTKACWHVLELQGLILKRYQTLVYPSSTQAFDYSPLNDGSFPSHQTPTSTPTKTKINSKNRTRTGNNKRVQKTQIKCCRALTYRYNGLRVNINSQMASTAESEAEGSNETAKNAQHVLQKQDSRAEAVDALRAACQYELEERFNFEHQKWLVVLFSIVGPDYESLSLDDIEALDDEQLWQALKHQSRNSSPMAGPTYDMECKKCHGCDRIERSRGDFEECSKCLKVSYCSFECQKSHWKAHKKVCSGCKQKWSPRSALNFPWL